MPRKINPDTQPVLTAVASGSYVIGEDIGANCTSMMIYADFGAGTSAGVITIEDAPVPAYPGTWAQQATISWSAASKIGSALVTGNFINRRIRISTNIVGGTVNVYYQAVG